MDQARRFVILLLAAVALAAGGCERDLDPRTMQMTGTAGAGGSMSDAGETTGGDATNCHDVVNAVHVMTENPGDACLFVIPDPDPNVVVDAYRIMVNGMYLPQDSIAGWGYTDATQRVIRIAGPVCDAIKAGSVQAVVVEYYCNGIA